MTRTTETLAERLWEPLRRIRIRGFKSIKDADLALGPINVLIGANGAGKSNLIGLFRLLERLAERRLQEYVAQQGGAARLLHLGPKITPSLSITWEFLTTAYEVELRPSVTDQLFTQRMVLFKPDNGMTPGQPGPEPRQWTPAARVGPRKTDETGWPEPAMVDPQMSRWQTYHFLDTSELSPIKRTQDVGDNRQLRHDASNLAPFLSRLEKSEPVSYRRIREIVQRVAPFFADFRLAPLAANPEKMRLEWRHIGSDDYFDGSALSDGTLRFMCLATLLEQPASLMPRVMLIDEPELGLHPAALTLLAEMLRGLPDNVQVIIATQSRTLLDHFDPNEVIVVGQDNEGSHFRHIDEHSLQAWLDDDSLGELWLKNVLGGRPV